MARQVSSTPGHNPMLPDIGGGPPATHRFNNISIFAGSNVGAEIPMGFLHPSTHKEFHVKQSFHQAIQSVGQDFHALRTNCQAFRTGCQAGFTSQWGSC